MNHAYMSIRNPETPYRLTDLQVFFNDLRCLDVINGVLDGDGKIQNFPGIIRDERWAGRHRLGQCYDVRFEARFFALASGGYLMLWLIQPSGWHWADSDGFGFSGDSSITLYAVLDPDGMFTGPFELFSINRDRYCHEFDEYVE